MGFVERLRGRSPSTSQKAAVDAVYDLLEQDNTLADRKEMDCVQATDSAIVITNWGVEADEAARKHELTITALAEAGLSFEDKGVLQQKREVIGGVEGTILLHADVNGGFSAIADKADAARLDKAAASLDKAGSQQDIQGKHSARLVEQRQTQKTRGASGRE